MDTQDTNLKTERLRAEIEFLSAITEKVTNPPQKKTWIDFIPMIGSLITVLGGGLALFMSVNSLIEQQKKVYSMTYSSQMVDFLEKSRSDDEFVQDQAIMLLSSYEMDAVPMLLLSLENSELDKQKIFISSFTMISNKETIDKEELLNTVMESSLDFIDLNFNEFLVDEREQNQKVIAIRNYIALLGGINMDNDKSIQEHYERIVKRLDGKKIDPVSLGIINNAIDREIEMMNE